MKAFSDGLPSFGDDSVGSALQKHQRLLKMAHGLEEKGAFREMNADRVIGYLALRLSVLHKQAGDLSAAERYRSESKARLVAGGIIPFDLSPDKKEELLNRELLQLLEMEQPKWKPSEEKPNQAADPTPTSVTPRADARVAPAAVVAHL